MKKYQLYRPLLYQDRRSIDEFIKEDPMWEELYRLYLQMRRQYHTKNKFVENIQHRPIFLCMRHDRPSSGR